MNLLLVGDSQLASPLISEGFNVFTASFNPNSNFPIEKYNFSIKKICDTNNIDVVVQVENLDKREILLDIGEIEILKVYYGLDVHLNYFWQKEYLKLFDIFISSQKNIADIHRKTGQHSVWLPWGIGRDFIKEDNFTPFKDRKYLISFVGLIDNNRLKRKSIIDNLSNRYRINIAGDTHNKRLGFSDMLQIYANSKIVINESINSEINFRYFEATSQGALLFTEKVSNGEDLLFDIDRDIVLFSESDIFEKIDFWVNHLEEAETIAINGFYKTLNSHTLKKRAQQLKNIIYQGVSSYKFQKSPDNDNSLIKSIFLISIRGIGKPSYLKEILPTFLNSSADYTFPIIKFFIIKSFDKKSAVQFLSSVYKTPDNLILANIVTTMIEIGDIDAVKKILIKDDIFEGVKDILKKLIREKNLYFPGYVNHSNVTVILNAFDLIIFLFKNYPDIAVKDRKLNITAAKILMDNKNYQAALFYLLNNIRNHFNDILTRDYLIKCYYSLYLFEFSRIEQLKRDLISKNYDQFRNDKNKNISEKREALLDIIQDSKDKSLIRDIYIYFEDFLKED